MTKNIFTQVFKARQEGLAGLEKARRDPLFPGGHDRSLMLEASGNPTQESIDSYAGQQ